MVSDFYGDEPLIVLPKVIGHRGAASLAPENTLPSIRKAAEVGVPWIEFDVKLTADNMPVIFHDENLSRTAGRDGLMAETLANDVFRLDVGSWFSENCAGEKVPSLAEALDLAEELDLSLNIEIKPSEGRGRETAEVSLDVLARAWPSSRPAPLISSFNRVCLEIARDNYPHWPRGLLVYKLPDDWMEALDEYACASFHIHRSLATVELVTAVKSKGVAVVCYTVNDTDMARSLYALGVDCIITDDPPAIMAVAAAL